MRTPVKLRTLTAEEVTKIKRLASSRKEPIRLVQRARIIVHMLEDKDLYASEAGLKAGYGSVVTGPVWVRHFNEKGLAGLEDECRPGRKPSIRDTVMDAYIHDRQEQSPIELMSLREREVLQLTVEGFSSAVIAEKLDLSPKTIDTYRSRLMGKLDIHDLTELVRFAKKHGLTPID